jgi:predicted metalloprotease with PDZ domain
VDSPSDQPQLHYRITMLHPELHVFWVELTIFNWKLPILDVKMPVWTPGSYLIREYSRHLQGFRASTSAGQPLLWRKCSKNHWQIETSTHSNSDAEIRIEYQIFANELSVRTNHLDTSHGYFNGAALFFYVPGFEQLPLEITVVPPLSTWQVTTALPAAAQPHTYVAKNYDTLVDSPFEIGTHALQNFEVLAKPHQFAIWGTGNLKVEQIIQDTIRIIQAEAQIFDGLPYDRYLFLLHLSSQGNGGLEHKDSCTLNYPRLGFRAKDKYHRFMQLVAHEFFHLWNVKRIRPQALETFNYDQENYTPSLWFSEGTTSYYDLQIPLRAGIYDVQTFLSYLGKEVTRFLTTPGRLVQPLQESSFDAWIKLYRPDANSINSQMSYYLKGEMVSLLLDLLIRDRFDNQRSLDDVMRQMWQQFGIPERGFTPEQLQHVIATVAGQPLDQFWQCYLDGTDELPFDQYLAPFGLQLNPEELESDAPPYLGLVVKSEAGREMIKVVEANSPAQKAGLDSGDELLAVSGIRVVADQLSERLNDFQPGDTIPITVFRRDQLLTCTALLTAPVPHRYEVGPINAPSLAQQQKFAGWLGVPFTNIARSPVNQLH